MIDCPRPNPRVVSMTTGAGRSDGARRPTSRRSVLAGAACGLGNAVTRAWREPCEAEAIRPAMTQAWWERLLPGSTGLGRADCGSERSDTAPRRWTEADLDKLLSVEDRSENGSTAPDLSTILQP